MKKRFLSLLLSAFVLLHFTGCQGKGAVDLLEGVSPIVAVPYGEPENWTTAVNGFALGLLRESAPGAENTLFSPISLMAGLGLAMNGAAGETLKQMEADLGLAREELNGYFSGLTENPPEGIVLANALWLRDEAALTVERGFLQRAAGYYRAGVFKGDFSGQTVQEVNSWIKDQTGGQVEQAVNEFSEASKLCLINALTFEGDWQNPYEKENEIRPGIFTASGGEERTVDFLCSMEVFLGNEECSGFFKPYQGGRYAFAALLPNGEISLDQFITGLTAEKLAELLQEPKGYIQAAFPKFEAEYAGEMDPIISALGMGQAFQPGADFSAMGYYGEPEESLYIGEIHHQAAVSVGEKGTKAGAAVAVNMYTSSAAPAPSLWFNRPFLYLILDVENAALVFIGTLVDPMK